jgi:hypothetical protein
MIEVKLTDFTRDELNVLYSAVMDAKTYKTETLFRRNQVWFEATGRLNPTNDTMKKDIEALALWEVQVMEAIKEVAVREMVASN